MAADNPGAPVAADFLTGGGECGALMRTLDWSGSPLGPPASWPQSLRLVTGLLLNSKFPMFVAWGAELGFLYNDTYAEILGAKHPKAMGRRFQEVWQEIWADISPLKDRAMGGEATYHEDLPLLMHRNGFDEQTWFTFSYSPVRDESGAVSGMFCACTETTQKVRAQRRRAFLSTLGEKISEQADPRSVMMTAAEALASYLGANRVGFAEVQADDDTVVLGPSYVNGVPSLSGAYALSGFGPEAMARQRQGHSEFCEDIANHPDQDPAVWKAIETRAFASVPLIRDGRFVASLYVNFREPHDWPQAEREVIEAVAQRSWSAVERAHAEAALKESEERLRLSAEAAEVGHWDVDLVQDVLIWPPRVKAMFGISPDVPVSMADFYAGIHPDDSEHVGEAFAAATDPKLRALYDVEYRTIGKEDGLVRWVAAKGRGQFDDDGRCVRVIGTAIDISERRRIEEALRESEARLRALTDHLPGGMVYQIATGADGTARRFLYVSQSHEQLTGITAEAVLADPTIPYQLILPDDRDAVGAAEEEALRSRSMFDVQARFRRADGAIRWSRIISAPREQEDGSLIWDGIQIDITDQKETEAALQARGEEFYALADNMPALCWMAQRDGHIFWYNRRWYEYTGTSPKEMEGWGWQSVHDPEVLPEVGERWRVSLDTGEPFEMVFPLKGADGNFRPFLTRIVPIRDEAGAITRWFGTNADISELRRTEEALRESESRFQAIANSIDQMIWSTRPDGFHDFFNQRWYDYTGVPEGTTDGAAWNGMFHPDDQERAWGTWRESLVTGEPYEIEYRLRHRSGEYRWVLGRAQPVRDETGQIARWFGTCTDIEEIVRAREVLAKSREELEREVAERTRERDRTWALSQDLMAVAAFDGLFKAVNPAFKRMLGYEPDQLLEQPFADLIHPDDLEAAGAIVQALRDGQPTISFEDRLRHADGSWRWIEWTAVPEGELFYATGRDITAQKEAAEELEQAQAALRQSQKMEAMGQLTGGVAHDFNNLLTPIVGSLDLLQRRGLGGPREQRLIDGALQSAERAKTLVQRLLAFARRQPLQASAVDLAGLVGGMADLIASTSGPKVQLAVEIGEDLPAAQADPNQLEMAILNLAVNARDAMPDGGRLTISAAAETLAPGNAVKLPPGQYVRLSVADTGLGMDEATLAKAIEPFFSTKGIGKGTGLGLSMVHGLASQLGGALRISSRPGLGTSAELWLPASTAPAQAEEQEAAEITEPQAAGTALLVDDEELVRMSTADMLSDLGYAVVEAASAEEALRLLDGGLKPDVLVTDHMMPGLTGAELARKVRERLPGTAVLIVSGYADAESLAPEMPRLTKPFRQADLATSLAELADG